MSQSTPASEFRKKNKQGIPIELPSGNTCLVRTRPGIDAFLTQGIIPNRLLPLIQKAIAEGSTKGLDQQLKKQNGEFDEGLLNDVLEAMDRVLCFVVISPKVKMPPTQEIISSDGSIIKTDIIPEEKRDLDADGNQIEVDWLYADEVDFEDKNFIYNWAMGGSPDLERFRAEQAANVEAISNGQNLEHNPERPSVD